MKNFLVKSACTAAVCFSALMSASAAGTAANTDWSGDGGVPAFYTWQGKVPTTHGKMLRSEALPAAFSLKNAAKAYRILYSSTAWPAMTPAAVSGAIFIPKGTAPKGGWPVLAWAHGTTGYADVCAPSNLPRSARDTKYLNYWLSQGYAIVATDYQGLGTKGPHPYLHYDSEGMGVLDSVRAALATHPELSHKIVTIGQSQGSGAAIGAAYIAPKYAPELDIRGTVATGIVAHTTNIHGAKQVPVKTLYAKPDDYSNAGFEVLFLLGTVRSYTPAHIRSEDYVSDTGMPLMKLGLHACLHQLFHASEERKVSMKAFYTKPIDTLNALADKTSDFPDVKIKTPVFTGTGLADTMAQTSTQYNFISAMCAAGTTVQPHYYPHATHSGAVNRSLADSPAFVRAVFAGKTVKNMCSALTPPGPTQTPGSKQF